MPIEDRVFGSKTLLYYTGWIMHTKLIMNFLFGWRRLKIYLVLDLNGTGLNSILETSSIAYSKKLKKTVKSGRTNLILNTNSCQNAFKKTKHCNKIASRKFEK